MSRPIRIVQSLRSSTLRPHHPVAGPSRPHSIQRRPTSRPFTSTALTLANLPSPLPRDADIPFNLVQLVRPDDNTLSDPQPLRHLLTTYDRSTHCLILVSSDPPVVKLLDQSVEAARAREADARESIRRRTAAEEKEVQITWGAAAADLTHKMTQAKSLLEKGDRVKIVFAPRQGEGKDRTTGEVKAGIVRSFEEGLGEVGKKWKEDSIKGKMVMCFWEAEGAVKEVVKAKVMEVEVEMRREKADKREKRRMKDEKRRRVGEERKKMGLGET